MIPTLLRIYWTSLSRDRVAQAMTFLLPILFFSIFATVFGGRGRDGMARVPVAVADEDRSALSRKLIRALEQEKSLTVRTTARPVGAARGAAEVPIDRARATAMVREGDLSVAIVIPAGFDTSVARFDGGGVAIAMLSDPSDPVAPQMVAGLLQKVAMTAAPELMARNGIGEFVRYSGPLTAQQRKAMDEWLPALESESPGTPGGAGSDTAQGGAARLEAGGGFSGLVKVESVEVVGEKRDDAMVSFYAAGIAVMFLLFSASAAGGALLDELDTGTLERVLTSNVGMTGLLAGKWTYITLLGILQICVMFLWGRLAFGLDLFHHLPGFAVMTVVTAATAAGFGLVLATLCRTRQQLGGISTIVILSISAVGGSMFPRFLMSAGMQKLGLFAFNAWALDGYIKVFWRNARLVELAPQVGVLLGFMAAFLIAARLLARRWERT
jgi:ABC-2 type transport system permease protein